MLKTIYTILLYVLCSNTLLAQSEIERESPNKVVQEQTDYEEEEPYVKATEKRYYVKSKMEAFQKDKDFKYDEEAVKKYERENKSESTYNTEQTQPSNKQKTTRTVTRKEYKAPTNDGINWTLILILFGVVIIGILALSGLNPTTLFRKKIKNINDLEGNITDEKDIHKIAFETELEKAIREKKYNIAVRILYLETLKKLNDGNWIIWQLNKKNWEYVRESESQNLRKDFTFITNSFDYVWYGNFKIDEPTYNLMQQKIRTFQQKI